MSAKKVAVATHKGGTGKTVTTITVGAALARAGKRVLLVDLDPQGHLALGLGIELKAEDPTILHLLTPPQRPLQEIIRPTTVPNLHVLPSEIRLSWAIEQLSGRAKRHEILKERLGPAVDEAYDWVFFDCPPSLGFLTENAVHAADFAILPSGMEARARDAIGDFLEFLKVMRGEDHERFWRILLTRYDSRKSTTNEAVLASLEQWSNRIFETRIPQSEPLNQAQIMGQDVFAFQPKCQGAEAYQAFSIELSNLNGDR